MVIGHHLILEFLKKSAAKKKVAHAYLFAGPSCVGKKTVALQFIKTLTGIDVKEGVHPDVLIIEPLITENKGVKKESEISIDQARRIKRQMSLSPHQSEYKVVIIDQAERMSGQAANALLKTLEEPAGSAVIILISSNPGLLLTTIVSRCQLVNFLPVAEKEIIKALPKASRKIISLSAGRPGLAISYLNDPSLLKRQDDFLEDLTKLVSSDLNTRYIYAEKIAKDVSLARAVLGVWTLWFRDLILIAAGCQDLAVYPDAAKFQHNFSIDKLKNILKSIKKTDLLLSNSSINARLSLEVLMLDI